MSRESVVGHHHHARHQHAMSPPLQQAPLMQKDLFSIKQNKYQIYLTLQCVCKIITFIKLYIQYIPLSLTTPATLGSSITFLKCDMNSRKSSVSVSPLIMQILTC